MKISRLMITFLSLVLSACSVGPYEEHQRTADPEGPGLFSGKKGEFSYDDYFSPEAKQQRAQKTGNYYLTDNNVDIPTIDHQSFEDFENFKAWRRAQDPNSSNHQEYQDWRAYQQYLRFKAEKQTKTKQSPP